MKQLLLLSILFLLSIVIKAQTTVLNGKIKNLEKNEIVIGDKKITATNDGNFQYAFSPTKPQYLEIKNKDFNLTIFIEPNEEVELFLDCKNKKKTISFEGKSKIINQFLFDLNKVNNSVSKYINSEWVIFFSMDEKAFNFKLEEIKNSYFTPFNELKKNNKNLNKYFTFSFANNINFTFDKYYLNFSQLHNKYTGNKKSLSKKTKKYINNYQLDNPDFIDVDGYQTFGFRWIAHMKRPGMKKGNYSPDNRDLDASLKFIDNKFENPKTKEYWYYQILNNHIDNHGVKNIKPFIEKFNDICKNINLRKKLNQFYQTELKKQTGHKIYIYKEFKDFSLEVHVFNPPNLKSEEKRPAMVYFHGGSWSEGKPDWHFGRSDHGFINFCVEYRTYDRHGTLPFEEVSDAKSLFRWLRKNADKLQIDPEKIIASGNSAGGHLILAAAMLNILDEPNEDQTISSKPNALILNSAAYDLTKWKWFTEYVKDPKKLKAISPTQNISKNLPPMIVYHGTEDGAVPFDRAETFVNLMKEAGNKIEFYPIKDVGHSLWFSGKYWRTAGQMNAQFFRKHGFVK